LIHNNPVYAAMVASLDMGVGRILECLEEHGLTDHTLVIFTSDNGGLTQRNGRHDGFTENLPLRRGKGSAYEGGVRVPRIMRWPGVTRPGSVCEQPVMSIDDYPTILEATGVSGDRDHNALVDGRSLVPLLEDPSGRMDRNLYWHYPHYHAGGDWPYSAVRSGDWRLIESLEDGHLELYNLRRDPGEQQNVKGEPTDRMAILYRSLQSWRERVGAQMPVPNPRFVPDRAAQVAK
jgi:arylsulfatase A-like enzyme